MGWRLGSLFSWALGSDLRFGGLSWGHVARNSIETRLPWLSSWPVNTGYPFSKLNNHYVKITKYVKMALVRAGIDPIRKKHYQTQARNRGQGLIAFFMENKTRRKTIKHVKISEIRLGPGCLVWPHARAWAAFLKFLARFNSTRDKWVWYGLDTFKPKSCGLSARSGPQPIYRV